MAFHPANGSYLSILALVSRSSSSGLQDIVTERRVGFTGHILRLSEHRLVKHAMIWVSSNGRRRWGRPRNTWRSYFREDLKNMNLHILLHGGLLLPGIAGVWRLNRPDALPDAQWRQQSFTQISLLSTTATSRRLLFFLHTPYEFCSFWWAELIWGVQKK